MVSKNIYAINVLFSELRYMFEMYSHEEVGVIRCCNGSASAYGFKIDGMMIVRYLSRISSAMASGDVIDGNWLTDANKFIMFGSAGSLDSDTTNGKFVIPTESYQKDSLSYNYIAPADYIEIKI